MSKYLSTGSYTDAMALDKLSEAGVVVCFCAPAGLFGSLERTPSPSNCPGLDVAQVARALGVTPARLQAEREAAGDYMDAIALILDEQIRAGFIYFSDLLIHYAVPLPGGQLRSSFLIMQNAFTASAIMLDFAGTALEGTPPEACDE